jgi:1-(5-phosphoribosyl)-5-[(5-phosphoribosylamino)methylideneamino] imidazole-4-carboxamide isomerase/N-(5'phosphoribosyl)anthranilate isomerase
LGGENLTTMRDKESSARKKLELLPAIDVKGGRAVRLVQGELSAETQYGNPVDVAQEFVSAGAEWIHLVDLDAAFGIGSNAQLLADVINSVDIQVELSGGIRDDDSLRRALATGCKRVNLGTAALENPDWTEKVIAEFGDRIAVGLDVRGHTLAARGWTREGGNLFETIERLERNGCSRYIVTDVAKDGTLAGPNLELLKEVCAATSKPVVASGGVSNLNDLKAIRNLTSIGVEGSIVGKALYSGAFTLQDALHVAGD